jgi:hypothetical protein
MDARFFIQIFPLCVLIRQHPEYIICQCTAKAQVDKAGIILRGTVGSIVEEDENLIYSTILKLKAKYRCDRKDLDLSLV